MQYCSSFESELTVDLLQNQYHLNTELNVFQLLHGVIARERHVGRFHGYSGNYPWMKMNITPEARPPKSGADGAMQNYLIRFLASE